MSATATHTVMQAMEVRVGDVLAGGREVVATKSVPMRGVGGAILLTFADDTTQHLAVRTTVIALSLADVERRW